MAFEGAQMVPVYDMNKSDNAGMMGSGAGWMWVIMLFFLLAWGGFGERNARMQLNCNLVTFLKLKISLMQFVRSRSPLISLAVLIPL